MNERYLFRARLEFDWHIECGDGTVHLVTPKQLPIRVGPFRFDRSPNFELYLADLGWVDAHSAEELYNLEYPPSLLYIETEIYVPGGQDPEEQADDLFERLEGILRLFQGGDVFIRRQLEHKWRVQENGVEKVFVGPKSSEPEPPDVLSSWIL